VADAAARQLDHVAGAGAQQAAVDVDAPQLVDDDGDAPMMLGAEQAVQQGGFSRTEKAGQDDEGDRAV
jgi:hypothetical protein